MNNQQDNCTPDTPCEACKQKDEVSRAYRRGLKQAFLLLDEVQIEQKDCNQIDEYKRVLKNLLAIEINKCHE